MSVKIDMFVLPGRRIFSCRSVKRGSLRGVLSCLLRMILRMEVTKRMVKTVRNHMIWRSKLFTLCISIWICVGCIFWVKNAFCFD
jgi:hypothetical protein